MYVLGLKVLKIVKASGPSKTSQIILYALIQGFSTGTLFFNGSNFGYGNCFVILFFDICQVESLKFITMSEISIENCIKIIKMYNENGGSVETTYRKISDIFGRSE